MGRTSDAKQKLIDSAIELIHSRSFADVGVNELCQHAGVKKGSFYHFFPSKQDLTLTALDVLADEFVGDVGSEILATETEDERDVDGFHGLGVRLRACVETVPGAFVLLAQSGADLGADLFEVEPKMCVCIYDHVNILATRR